MAIISKSNLIMTFFTLMHQCNVTEVSKIGDDKFRATYIRCCWFLFENFMFFYLKTLHSNINDRNSFKGKLTYKYPNFELQVRII